jgi:hypothetical protein
MSERKPVGIDFLVASCFVHQAAHGPVRRHHSAELLLDKLRSAGKAQHSGLEIVEQIRVER